MANKVTYSYEAKDSEQGGGMIQFHTTDDKIYESLVNYIDMLIDAEQYRRQLHRTRLSEGIKDGMI